MNVDWASFTPLAALIGGALIGLASAILILVNGKVAGISGILAGLLRPADARSGWRLFFVLGLALAPLAWWAVSGSAPGSAPTTSWPLLAVSGLLVGVGTRVGGGCTSGHGVCGLSRLSPRSLVATGTFMAAGILTAVVTRHVLHAS